MGDGLKRIAQQLGGLKVTSNRSGEEDTVVYGPNTDDNLTTDGLVSNQEVRLLSGKRPFRAKIVRVLDDKLAMVIREFPTSGKWSKPFKAHISAIERVEKASA